MAKHNITVEDSSPLIAFTGNWADSPYGAPDYTKFSGYSVPDFNSVHKTNGSDKFEFTFNGTAIYVFGSQSPVGGQFVVTLDDANGAQIDNAKGTTKAQGQNTTYQTLLYSHTKLDGTQPHNLRIDNGGDGEFALDFLVVESDVGADSNAKVQEITLDDTSSAFSYPTGQWNATVAPAEKNIVTKYWGNSTEHNVDDIGAQVELKFRGSGVQIHGTWALGNITASLDGGPLATYASDANHTAGIYQRPRELLFMADGLTEGDHTVLLTSKGFSASTFKWLSFNVDYATVSTADTSNTNGLATGAPPSNTTSTTTPNKDSSAVASVSLSTNTMLMAFLLLWMIRKLNFF